MKLSDITRILADAGLPALSREQLIELAGTDAGKRFQTALVAFSNGDPKCRAELAATVQALGTDTKLLLQRLGSKLPTSQVVIIACKEQHRFFDAIAASETNTERGLDARRYLTQLGIHSEATPARATLNEPPYYSFKIFGAGAALCIAEATSLTERKHTINVEGATILASNGGRKMFDWANKIVVQLTVQEAYQVLALLENKIRQLRFDGHGRAHDKSLQIAFQDSHYFFRLIQRGRAAVAVQVRAVDSLQIVSLLYKQLLRNDPHLRIDDLRVMVERMASMSQQTAGQLPSN